MTRTNVNRSSIGKASNEKGKSFEERVSDLFVLAGAHVTRDVEICNKQIDLLAEFRITGSSIVHRVIVECKNEVSNRADNQRVMEYDALLSMARKTGEADSMEVITATPWSSKAKAYARKAGISVLTFKEKLCQLIDFTGYLKKTISDFEEGSADSYEAPLGAYYVPLSGERNLGEDRNEIPSLDDHIQTWAVEPKAKTQLAILGEFGMGKSSLCKNTAYNLSKKYLNDPTSSRIPIIINLRDFTKTLRIEPLITSLLDEECGVSNPKYAVFKAMNDAGVFFIMFDGFDEMAVKVDADTLEQNLLEIEKLASSPNAKVMLTSRPEYFISADEERKLLLPSGSPLEPRRVQYDILSIKSWDDTQIDTFLEKRVPLIENASSPWTFYRQKIRAIPGLSDLSKRPVLLEMIVKTLPDLIEKNVSINRPNLYELYLNGEIKRQKVLKRRKFLFSDEARFDILQEISLLIYLDGSQAINYEHARMRIQARVNPPSSELEAYTREFLSCSFLVRDGNDYQFSHRSFFEYLCAKELINEIQAGTLSCLDARPLPPLIAEFLVELDPPRDLFEDIVRRKYVNHLADKGYLQGNAATILSLIDPSPFRNIPEVSANFVEANLCNSFLTNVSLSGSTLRDCLLVNTKFNRENLHNAALRNVIINFYIVVSKVRATKDFDILDYTTNPLSKLIEQGKLAPRMARPFNTPEIKHELVILEAGIKNIETIDEVKNVLLNQRRIKSVLAFDSDFTVSNEQLGENMLSFLQGIRDLKVNGSFLDIRRRPRVSNG